MKKRILKIVLSFLGIITLLFIVLAIYVYFKFYHSTKINQEKHPNYIGYINPDKALLNSDFTLCNREKIYSTYSGLGLDAYRGSKKTFKNTILSKYDSLSYNDSGYISYRFLVNCKGEAGWFEIIEMNLDLEETKLDKKIVESLLKLTSSAENWNTVGWDENENVDYYMYVLYRIENGKIVEILP